jgi:GAF domain-containing protein
VFTPIGAGLMLRFTNTGKLRQASWLFVAVLVLVTAVLMWREFDGALQGAMTIIAYNAFLLLPLLVAGALLDRRGIMIVLLLLVGVVGVRAVIQTQIPNRLIYFPQRGAVEDAIVLLALLFIAGASVYIFGGSALLIARAAASENTRVRLAARFNARYGSIEDEQALLQKALEMLHDEMGYSFAQIYIMTEDGTPTRRIRTGLGAGESGALLSTRAPDLGVVAEVARERQMQMVTLNDSGVRSGHIIPPAQSALIVPLLYFDVLIGVLDVHNRASQFTPEDMAMLQLFAEQVTATLIQSRTVADLRRSLRDQEESARSFRAQLADVRRSGVAGAGEWSAYLAQRGQVFGYDLSHEGQALRAVAANDLPEHLRPALERGEITVEHQGDEQIINVPIISRGETLGAMSFALPAAMTVNERQLELVRTVSNRLGLALENTRLFEQTQAQAARERKANEVASLLISATDVRSVLNLAAESFNEVLGAIHTRVYLQPQLLEGQSAQSEEVR